MAYSDFLILYNGNFVGLCFGQTSGEMMNKLYYEGCRPNIFEVPWMFDKYDWFALLFYLFIFIALAFPFWFCANKVKICCRCGVRHQKKAKSIPCHRCWVYWLWKSTDSS